MTNSNYGNTQRNETGNPSQSGGSAGQQTEPGRQGQKNDAKNAPGSSPSQRSGSAGQQTEPGRQGQKNDAGVSKASRF